MGLTLLGLLAFACGKKSHEPDVALTTISGEACADGSVACGDSCVHLASSAQNCGGCGSVCAGGDICDRGRSKRGWHSIEVSGAPPVPFALVP